jgi:hypothetical protein
MKLLFFFCFIFLFGLFGSRIKKPPKAAEPIITLNDTINFARQVQPILVKNCSPCHFNGGKMYERMPFDQDTTIINHEKGVLRRIKGDENVLIRSFIQQQIKQ